MYAMMRAAPNNTEEADGCFSTDTMRSSILEIQNEAVNQQLLLQSLKQKRMDLENDIKRKVAELNKAKEEQLLLEGQLKNSEQRMEELQKQSCEGEEHIAVLRQNAQEVMQHCDKEKELQMKYTKDYEAKMVELTQRVLSGPQIYDKEALVSELAGLRQERVNIHQELAAIEKDMGNLRSQLGNLVSKNTNFQVCSGNTPDLSCALRLILTEGKITSSESENRKLEEEIKNLERVTAELRAETKGGN